MTKQKIIFTIKNKDEAGPLELTIEKVQIPTKEGSKEVEKIFFCVSPSERENIKNTLESKKTDGTENKVFELEYDDEDLKVEEKENLFMASKASSGPAKQGPKPKTVHKLNDKGELKIWEVSLITVAAKGETTPEDNNKKPETPKTPDQKNPGPDNPNKGPSDPNPNQPDKSPEKEDKSKPQDTPSGVPKPNSEQINQAKDKLDQAKSSDNKEDIKNTLNETNDTVRNCSDKDLKNKKEEVEKRLGELDKEELRKQIRDEVSNELKRLGIKPENFVGSTKQKFDDLNNNNNNNNIEPNQAQEYRNEVLNEAATSKFNELITKLEQAIKQNNEKEIKEQSQELRKITQDNSDHIQKAYQDQKDKINQLLESAKNQQSSQNNEGFFRPNNPLMWLAGIFVIGLVVGIVLIISSRRKNLTVK